MFNSVLANSSLSSVVNGSLFNTGHILAAVVVPGAIAIIVKFGARRPTVTNS